MLKQLKIMQLLNTRVFLLVACGLLAVGSFARAQEPAAEESTDPAAQNEEPVNDSHETEVTEDNYRRFMELRDQRGERTPLPASAYVKPASLEKMQNLPEASQKHLRNELRDIILQGEQWTPEQIDKEYPYSPSEAAQSDRALQEQESDAWDELVSEYHAREADIYAHSERSLAASARTATAGEASTQGSNAKPGSASSSPRSASGSQGSAQPGASGESTTGAQQDASQGEASPGEASMAGTFSTSQEDSRDKASDRGVSQNALEFLLQSGNAGQASTAAGALAQESSEPAPAGADTDEIAIVSPGVIAIEDLDKVQGVIVITPGSSGDDGATEEEEEEEEEENPPEEQAKDG